MQSGVCVNVNENDCVGEVLETVSYGFIEAQLFTVIYLSLATTGVL